MAAVPRLDKCHRRWSHDELHVYIVQATDGAKFSRRYIYIYIYIYTVILVQAPKLREVASLTLCT